MPPPDRWEVYIPLGKVIPKTKIIAFKVPLREHLQVQVEEKDQFSPSILTEKLREQGLKLGLIIDLTFTHKYYDRQEFVNDGISHKKIFVKGHVIPSDEVFQEFVDAVKSCGEEDSVVGVHCTHGVNRTGYLICRYMIEELNIEPEEAISLFNEARGHSIERENYLLDLKNRQQGVKSLSEEDNPRERKKERWRHHRSDHPNWRQKSRSSWNDDRQGRDSYDFAKDNRRNPGSVNGYDARLAQSSLDAGYQEEKVPYRQAGWSRQRDSWGRHGDSQGRQGSSWGRQRDSQGRPGDSWDRQGDSRGRQGDSLGSSRRDSWGSSQRDSLDSSRRDSWSSSHGDSHGQQDDSWRGHGDSWDNSQRDSWGNSHSHSSESCGNSYSEPRRRHGDFQGRRETWNREQYSDHSRPYQDRQRYEQAGWGTGQRHHRSSQERGWDHR